MQQLVLADCSLDDGVELTVPVDLQLVLVPAPGAAFGELVHLLVRASEKGNVEAVRLLLFEAGLSKGLKNMGNAALISACGQGHEEIVCMLLEAGANPNFKDIISGNTALIRASDKGHVKIASMLLKEGAIPNLKDIVVATQRLYVHATEATLRLFRLLWKPVPTRI